MTSHWIAHSGGAVGARHEHRGDPCEDAHGAGETPQLSYVAVSDGHGSAQHTRAATGARFAVEVIDSIVRTAPRLPVAHTLATQIVEQWRTRCAEHVLRHPLSDAERGFVSRAAPAVGVHLLFGATVITAIADIHEVVTLQIGDGETLLAPNRDSNRASAELSNETESLCLPDASERAKVTVHRAADLEFVALATDGFGAAFITPDWHAAVIDDISSYLAASGREQLDEAIVEWCTGPAETGGDDASLALLIRADHDR